MSATMTTPSAAAEKRLATLIARAALAGVTVNRIEGDFAPEVFVATHDAWALTREFATLDELDAWLDRVDGKAVA